MHSGMHCHARTLALLALLINTDAHPHAHAHGFAVATPITTPSACDGLRTRANDALLDVLHRRRP